MQNKDLINLLNQQAEEIAKEGHNGWGNTMLLAAEHLAKLDKLLAFAIEGLNSAPHSWGLDITHIQKIERDLSDS